MYKYWPYYFCCLSLLPQYSWALPQGIETISGDVSVSSSDAKGLTIKASDKAIIQYERFDIGCNERVQFLQPGSTSVVLNRVCGSDPSSILGQLQANGRIFFVNPNGIYFGPDARVNVGSFIASTLDIQNQDFLSGRFQFSSNGKNGEIVNEGRLVSSLQGAIALLAPHISNEGFIQAKAGTVLLASAERVVIDFAGDGLMYFALDGEVGNQSIYNRGVIQAPGGEVFMQISGAQQILDSMVNCEGVIEGVEFLEENGVIHLLSSSSIEARKIEIEGPKVLASGHLNAENVEGAGGRVSLLGDQIHLVGTQIDVSGKEGGGVVLIGGEYQGKGKERTAWNTKIDDSTRIFADALEKGDGGRVIVWADYTTIYDGQIFARGGLLGGDGGFVETSGKEGLGIDRGNVNTLSLNGKAGTWLLDPNNITVVNNATDQGAGTRTTAANCADMATNLNINTGTINAATSNLILCANGNIVQQNGAVINIAAAGIGLTYQIQSGGTITIQGTNTNPPTAQTTTTNGGAVTFSGPLIINNGIDHTINTNGGNVSFNNTIVGQAGGNPSWLTINAGAGQVTFSNTLSTDISQLLITAGNVNCNASITLAAVASGNGVFTVTNSGTFTTNSSGVITAPGGFSTTGAANLAANITTTNTALTIGGNLVIAEAASPTLAAGSGTVTITGTTNGTAGGVAETVTLSTTGAVVLTGAVGGTDPLGNLTFTGNPSSISLGASVTVTGANTLTFPSPVSLTAGPITITSNNANIGFSSTINGGQSLTLTAGTGTPTFTGVVGGVTPLTTLTVSSAAAVNFTAASYTTTSTQSYTATGNFNLSAATTTFSTTNSNVSFLTGTVQIPAASTYTVSAGTGTIQVNAITGASTTTTNLTNTGAGQAILTGTISTGTLNFSAGTGTIHLRNTISISPSNASLSFPSGRAVLLDNSPAATATSVSITPASGLNVTFNSTIDSDDATQTRNLTVTTAGVGTISLLGQVGSTTRIGTFTIGSGSAGLSIGSAVTTIAANSFTVAGTVPTTLNNAGLLTVNTSAFATGSIAFGGTITGAVAGSQALTLTANATGSVTLSGNVGATRLGAFTIGSGGGGLSVGTGVTSIAANSFTVAGTVPTTLNNTGTLVIDTSAFATGSIAFGGTITGASAGAQALTLTANGTGNVTLSGNVGATRLGAITISAGGGGLSVGTGVTSIAANSFTVAGTVPTTLNNTGTLTIDTSGFATGSIAFGGTITGASAGAQPLTLTANATGNVTLSGNVGATRLGAFTIGAGGGGLSIGTGVTSIAANSFTVAGTVPTTLNNTALLTVDTSAFATGSIAFGGTITGASAGSQALTLTANGTGNVTLSGNVGATRLGAITISAGGGGLSVGTGVTSIAANSFTVAGTVPTTLNNTGTLTIDTSGFATGSIAFGGTITGASAGAQPLTLTANATGNVTLSGNVGATRLGAFTIGAGGGGLSIGTGVTSIAANSFTVAGTVPTTLNNTALLTVDTSAFATGSIAFGGTITGASAGAQALTLTANATGNVTLSGNVGATRLGAFTIGSGSGGLSIGTGVTSIAANSFTVAGTVPTTLNNTGLLTIDTSAFATGSIAFGGTITGASAGSQALTLTANGTGTATLSGNVGATRLGAIIISAGGGGFSTGTGITSIAANSFTVAGTVPTTLNNTGTLTIDTSGFATGSIAFGGTITGASAGAQPLTLTANATGNVTLSGNVGATRLGAFTIGAGGGGLSIGTGVTSIAANSFTVAGTVPTTLNNTALLTVDTSAFATGSIAFGGTITGASAGAQALTLTANATGSVTLSGNVGATRLGAFTIGSGSGGLSIGTGVTSIAANSFTVAGTVPTTLNNTVTLIINTSAFATGSIAFGGIITGASAGAQALTLTANTTGNVTLSGNVGATRLGAFTIGAGGGGLSIGTGVTSITANSFTVAGTVPTTLNNTALLTVDTSAFATGSIAFGGTITGASAGAQDLTLTANGTGSVTLSGNVGATRLGAFTIGSSSGELSIGTGVTSIAANSFTVAGTVPTTLNNTGLLTIDTSAFATGSIAFGGTITGASAGSQALTLTANGTGTVTLSGNVGATRLGAITISAGSSGLSIGTGVTSIAANSFTVGGTVPTTLNNTGTLTIDTSPFATGSIAFGGTITGASAGAQALTLNANGTGSVTLSGNVGATRLGAFTIGAGSGSLAIGSAVTSIAANSFTVGSGVPTTLNNTALLTVNTSLFGGAIAFGGTIDGAHDLTLNAGTGAVTLSGVVGGGTPLTTLTVSNSSQVSFGAASYTTTSAQSYTATGNFNLSAATTTFNTTNSNISFLTGTVQIPITSTFTVNAGTGTIQVAGINGASDTIANLNNTTTGQTILTGNITVGTLNFSAGTGNIQLRNTISIIPTNSLSFPASRAVVLNNSPASTATNISITPGSNSSVTFNATIDADSTAQTRNLTVTTSGAGNVTFQQNIGGTTRIGALTIGSGSNSLIIGAAVTNINASSFNVQGTVPTVLNNTASLSIDTSTTNGIISFGGTINAPGGQGLTLNSGSGAFTASGAIGNTSVLPFLTLTNTSSATFGGSLNLTGALTQTNAATGATTFNGAVSVGSATLRGTSYSVNSTFTSTGAVSVTNSGTFAVNGAISAAGGFSTTGNVSLGANITTTNTTLSIGGNLTLVEGATTRTLAAGSGAISLNGTVNGTAGGVDENLTLSTTGSVSIIGVIGGITPLGSLTFVGPPSTINVGGSITTDNSLTFPSPVQLTAGPITINTNGANLTFSNTISGAQSLILTAGSGQISLQAVTGLNSLSASSTSAIHLGGNISTQTASGVTFTGPVVLDNNILINTTSGNGLINFNGSTTTITGTQTLTLQSGSGTISLGGAVNVNSITTSPSTGTINLGANITTQTASGVVLTGPVNMTGTSAINTTTGNGQVQFSSTIDGNNALSINSGSGTITLSGAIGGTTPLSSFAATSTTAINLGVNITTQGASGVSFTAPISLTGDVAISTVTGNGSISFNGSTSTITGTQALTLTAGSGVITFGGDILVNSLSASGAVTMQANITTQAVGGVSITGPVTLGNPVTINSTTGSGPIQFNGTTTTIDGAQPLVLNAGAGMITLSGAIGSSSPLNSLSATSSTGINVGTNITTQTAAGIAFTGPVSLTNNSVMTTSTGAGTINFSSTINGTRTLSLNAGTGTITFNGAVGNSTILTSLTASGGTITQNSTVRTTGAVSYTGTNIQLGGNITTNSGAITMTGPITLLSNITLNSAAVGTGGNCLFTSTINGAHTFSVQAGSATVTFQGATGGTTPLSQFTVHANIINQNASVHTTGTITYNSTLNLGADLTTDGSDITINSNLVRTLVDSVTITTQGGLGGPANISINGTIEVDASTRNLTLITSQNTVAGENIISVTGDIAQTQTMTNLTMVGNMIQVRSIGSFPTHLIGTIDLNAGQSIDFFGTSYHANNHNYTVPTINEQFNMQAGATTAFHAGVSIQFNNGTIQLFPNTNLEIIANNPVNIALNNVQGTASENVTVITNGSISVGNIGTTTQVGTLSLNGLAVSVTGPIIANNVQVSSNDTITSPGSPLIIMNGATFSVFHSLNGTVGTLSDPIFVASTATVFAGATDLAVFSGFPAGNTIAALPAQPPCVIILNGNTIRDCHAFPPTPSPSSATLAASLQSQKVLFERLFFVPGLYSTRNHLGSDIYFLQEVALDEALRRPKLLYQIRRKVTK